MVTANTSTCPNCGRTVPGYASEGLCAPCLLAGVMEPVFEEASEDCEGDLAAGRLVGDYEIIERIARGGMGVVFRARERRLGREVALKMIIGAEFAGPEEVRRFRLEAEAAARLEHPHIVPVYATGEADGHQFFAMKLAEGGTLAPRVAEREPMPIREAAKLVAKVARAVHFAHERGILHRDLKPANILLDSVGEPLVADFGLAKFIEGGAVFTLTGAALGTPAYMAPEQADGGLGEVTTASDVYSIGAILYHALTGRQVFEGGGSLEVFRRLASEDPVSPRKYRPQLDEDMEAICMKCIERQPERRYASAAALADDLGAWLAGETVSARVPSPSRRLRQWARRRPALAASLLLGGAALIALTVFLAVATTIFRRQRDEAAALEASAKSLASIVQEEAAAARLSRERARENLYAADVFVVSTAIEEGNLGLAREGLARQVPAAGDADLRGFEWYAFQRICKGDDCRTLEGHTRAVKAVAFSPDGAALATAGTDETVRIWPMVGEGVPRVLPLADAPTNAAEIPMMLRLASRSPELTRMLATLELSIDEMRMRGRPSRLGEVVALAWSRDSRWLATASNGGFVRVWNAGDLSLETILPVTTAMQLAFTPDGSRLIIGAHGGGQIVGEIAIYDTASRERLHTLKSMVPHFALSADGAELFCWDGGLEFTVRAADTGAVLRKWAIPPGLEGVALSPDGRLLATTEHYGAEIVIRESQAGRVRGRLSVAPDRVRSLAFSHDGGTLIAGGTGHAVRLIDMETWVERKRLRGHGDEVLAVAASPVLPVVASGGNDRIARVWSNDSAEVSPSTYSGAGKPMALSRDAGTMLFGAGDGSVRRCELGGGDTLVTSPAEGRRVLGFAEEDREFATILPKAGGRAVVEFFAAGATPEAFEMPVAIKGDIVAALSPDGRALALRGYGTESAIYRIPGGQKLCELGGARRGAGEFRFSPDGALLAGFSWPRKLTVWDAKSGEQLARWTASDGTVAGFVFSPDGAMIASGGSDNAISLWDARTGALNARLRGHKAGVAALAFSPDGRTLATSGADRTLRLWHVATLRELGVLARGDAYTFLAFGGDGRRLVAADGDGRVWWFDAKE